MSQIIMAGTSPRRIELLRLLGVECLALPHGLSEDTLKDETPPRYAQRMALQKAQAVATQHAGRVVLAADTVVACGRRILPKAETLAQAEGCLALLSGRAHRVYTALSICNAQGEWRHRITTTRVHVKRLSDEEKQLYLASNEWHGKAGGYALQGIFAAFVPQIVGTYHAVLGLPLLDARHLLQWAQG